ncbi:MAG TPA: hypothetical protein VFF52_19155 [Isosphaeraceae bacterium]|nr:hypothetical protein [Isosphaeraceae bacterium]
MNALQETRSTRRPRSITGREVLQVAAVIGAVLLLTSLPYIYAYRSAPPDRQFMGILLNVPDNAQYLSWAHEFRGAFLIENKLTPEHGAAVFFNLFWFLIGRLALWLGLGDAETVELVRPVMGAVFLGAVYWFVSLFDCRPRYRWTSFLVIALGGGLGWLLVIAKPMTGAVPAPLDLYVAEPNTFLTVLAFPFQALAGGLLLLILGLAALAFERDSPRLAVGAGLLALVLGLQHGYDLLIVYAVVGSLTLVLARRPGRARRSLALGALVCLWSLPAAFYAAYLARLSPIWRGVFAQYGNAGVFTPPPAHLLILLGLPLILLAAGRPLARGGDGSPRDLLLRLWLIIGLFLLYIPTDFQIKMLSDWQVPVGILGTEAALAGIAPGRWPIPRIPGLSWTEGTALLLIVLVLPTNLYLFTWRFVDLGRHDYPYYLDRDDVAALRWIADHAAPSDVVLSSLTIGEYVPALTGAHAFLAHWAETLNFYEKRTMVARFFDPREDENTRQQILSRFGIRYVLVGPAEHAVGSFNPSTSACLQIAFSAGRTTVYAVRPSCQALPASSRSSGVQ